MVEAARRRWVAATYKRPQMVALPDPKLEYKYFVQQMAREEGVCVAAERKTGRFP